MTTRALRRQPWATHFDASTAAVALHSPGTLAYVPARTPCGSFERRCRVLAKGAGNHDRKQAALAQKAEGLGLTEVVGDRYDALRARPCGEERRWRSAWLA